MVPLYSLSIEHVNFNLWKLNFDRYSLIDFSILSVNCSHLCIIYVKMLEKTLSGGLEVSFSIYPSKIEMMRLRVLACLASLHCVLEQDTVILAYYWSV